MVALLGEVDRRFETQVQLANPRADTSQGRGERAFEMADCLARLGRRDGIDERLHRFRLHEVELSIEERAERELARPRRPGASRRGPGKHRRHHHRAAVR
jgi:hypothetical protein